MKTKIAISLAALFFGSLFLATPAPFAMQIVDADTGAPVAGVRVTSDNGIVCYSTGAGSLLWSEWSLMNRRVHFTLEDTSHRYDSTEVTLGVSIGGQAALTVSRHPAAASVLSTVR